MYTLDLIYTNAEYKNMINFTVDIDISYEMAYEQHSNSTYIPLLLKKASRVIKGFGDDVAFPETLSKHLEDVELNYFLLLIQLDIDLLIDAHIYVRIPAMHSLILIDHQTDGNALWRTNGIGLNGLLLARQGDNHAIYISTPTFQEVQDEMSTYNLDGGSYVHKDS